MSSNLFPILSDDADEAPVVAVVYDADGGVYDRCYTWEAGQSYALHEGRRVSERAGWGWITA